MAKNEIKLKRKNVGFSMDEELNERLQTMSKETGRSKAELLRHATRKLVDDGNQDILMMMTIIQMTKKLSDLKELIPDKEYEGLEQCVSNIITIKGGK